MNNLFLNIDTKVIMNEKELRDFLIEVEVEDFYTYSKQYFESTIDLENELYKLKEIKTMSIGEILTELREWGYNIEFINADMLYERSKDSNNLDYIKDLLNMIYAVRKKEILESDGDK